MSVDEKISFPVGEAAQIIASELPDFPEPAGFARAWFPRQIDAGGVLVGEPRLAASHARLGAVRAPGEDLIASFTPREATDGWGVRGSTILQVVTDDRPFLVDTATLVLTEAGWTVRGLHHPILSVTRDAAGRLSGVGAGGASESWITIEAYPPLGRSADAELPGVLERLRAGLAASRLAHDDRPAMFERLRAATAALEDTPQPASAREVGRITDFLGWVSDGNLELLGYREYTVDASTFTPVASTGLGILAGDVTDPFHAVPDAAAPELLVVTKDSRRAPVHRNGYLDYVAVRVFDGGVQVGEKRFLGLWSASAYSEPVDRIPLVADKARHVWAALGITPATHAAQVAQDAFATLPREEWFSAGVDDLADLVRTIATVQEQRQTRLLLREGAYGRFWSCLVFVPRDRYRTLFRERVSAILLERLGGESIDFRALVNETAMARLLLVVKRPDAAAPLTVDVARLEADVMAAATTWDDEFSAMADSLPAQERGVEFGEAYESEYTVRQALADLALANELTDPGDLRFAVYAPDDPDDPATLRFKVVTGEAMSLTRVMPYLNALGVTVTDERPYEWDLRGKPLYVYDFGFHLPDGDTAADWDAADRARFAEAFRASYTGACHAGEMNRLVMGAGLTWQQVTWLRGIARYLQQAGIPYSQVYVASALNANPDIAGALVAAFESRFDPDQHATPEAREEDFDAEIAEILRALDAVESLDQDRILRMFVAVMRAIVRTNAFAADQPALAFKIRPTELGLLPEPRPAHEIFVYSPRVQGVHLRFGAVARGGLRWSDRREDFRTEVLGLAKAQMVKNTVIVPVGAKGGFVPQRLPDPRADRAAWLAEGVACYEIFVSSLLSLTDNLVDGAVVPPPDVVRHDGDDTYLVVAADKGTATFSDIANRISVERGFWLGDAFASGGSVGYDHKGMGITARGAWESVKRHFFELGIDCQTADVTCIGIGDMAGDVFGNGMLLSEHIRLVGAFNHLHVFLDPNPDAAASFAERKRLFETPRSTWADYDHHLISAGGGVWPRTAKSIPIGPEVRQALGLADGVSSLTPNEVIKALLSAPVDLLWNGGIGTYVKASTETDAEVGDKANDAVRVDGRDVRARVAGEGGNLGWTQAGRIEFAHAGGRINTDFIDNSAGVDTSDHEVNIKILLQPEVAAGRLDADARAELLASMTDEVAQLVLAHNVDQNLALSVGQAQSVEMASAQEQWMRTLEADGLLDRDLEGLPSRAEMARRIEHHQGLTRPELAALLAWTKIRLEQLVLASDLPDDRYLADRLVTYFPKALRERYADAMASHPLRREIVTMVTVNRFVNSQGISAYHRLAEETASDVREIVRAQLAARNVFAVARDELSLPRLGLDADTEIRIRVELQRMVEQTTRWWLLNRRGNLDILGESAAFTEAVAALRADFEQLCTTRQREHYEADLAWYREREVPAELAERIAKARGAHLTLPVAQLASELGLDVRLVARVYFALAERLGLDRLLERVNELPRVDRWDTMARAALRDDLGRLQADLTRAALAVGSDASDAAGVVAAWEESVGGVAREAAELAEITADDTSLARMSVGLRTVRALLV